MSPSSSSSSSPARPSGSVPRTQADAIARATQPSYYPNEQLHHTDHHSPPPPTSSPFNSSPVRSSPLVFNHQNCNMSYSRDGHRSPGQSIVTKTVVSPQKLIQAEERRSPNRQNVSTGSSPLVGIVSAPTRSPIRDPQNDIAHYEVHEGFSEQRHARSLSRSFEAFTYKGFSPNRGSPLKTLTPKFHS